MEILAVLFFLVIPGLAFWFFRLWQAAKHELQMYQQQTPVDNTPNIDIDEITPESRILEDSPTLQAKLNKVLEQQKILVTNGRAVICKTQWTVGNSRAAGERMAKNQIKLMLFAFNGESDAIIERVSWRNLDLSVKKLITLTSQINTLGKVQACEVTSEYLNLKKQELILVHQYREVLNNEREEQRAIREQMREEEKALRELERAQIEAERDTERYTKALQKATLEAEKAQGDKQLRLLEEIERLKSALTAAEAARQRAISQAQMTKSGYVYIISNVGSFGENVYKIGMTRRLDPMDRVDELGDASVPFPFDVHAMIYTQDAPNLENTLHREFAQHRVNLENHRKEFFKVTLEAVESAVRRSHSGDFHLTLAAKAEQYRKSEAKRVQI
jgi:Meiotically up-regulated gene 113/Domain of unknown function (DUF4041)